MTERIKVLEARVAELEEENASLRRESSEYLRRWVSAQDLAAWRNCLLIAATSYPREDHPKEPAPPHT